MHIHYNLIIFERGTVVDLCTFAIILSAEFTFMKKREKIFKKEYNETFTSCCSNLIL